MLANWIHIVIVHFAVIGTPWLVYRVLANKKEPLNGKSWKVNYTAAILLGGIAATAYFTGPEAADYLKEFLDPYSQELVEDHALWGRVSFVIQVIAALIGIMGWASILQDELPDRRIPILLLILLILNTIALLYTSHLGGMIRRMDLT